MPFIKGHVGIYHPRKTAAVGGRERVRVSRWTVTIEGPDGTTVSLDLQGRYTSAGHVRLHVGDYLRLTKRPDWRIAAVEKQKTLDADLEALRTGASA
jgi:hypothetical protein